LRLEIKKIYNRHYPELSAEMPLVGELQTVKRRMQCDSLMGAIISLNLYRSRFVSNLELTGPDVGRM
jgi:hypothetical protein